jgi:uncharacterized protein (DUF2147 family)
MTLRSAFALAVLLATTALAHAEPIVNGFWEARDSDGNPTAWFLFSGKNDVFSARLVKGFKPKDPDAPPPKEICTECPGKKKGAHIMGLTLFYGMKRDGLHYTDGSVLDPRDGSVYHALMNLSDDGKELEVRGYLGISMFGKSQTWYRLPDDSMKKEDIPKEILAGADDAAGDKTSKMGGKTATADKKHKKTAKTKMEPTPDATPEAADSPTPAAEKAQ